MRMLIEFIKVHNTFVKVQNFDKGVSLINYEPTCPFKT
jgi:hypothetical protein